MCGVWRERKEACGVCGGTYISAMTVRVAVIQRGVFNILPLKLKMIEKKRNSLSLKSCRLKN